MVKPHVWPEAIAMHGAVAILALLRVLDILIAVVALHELGRMLDGSRGLWPRVIVTRLHQRRREAGDSSLVTAGVRLLSRSAGFPTNSEHGITICPEGALSHWNVRVPGGKDRARL